MGEIMFKDKYKLTYDDYAQSANTSFHEKG